MALPSALAGIVWILFGHRTTLSVPALTGAIMCMGVATANSILVITLARERFGAGADALTAALDAGRRVPARAYDALARSSHGADWRSSRVKTPRSVER